MPVVFFDEVFAQQARSTKQIITNDVIENVRCVLLEEFDEDEVKLIQSLHKRLLHYSKEKNDSNEVGLLVDLSDWSDILIEGTEEKISMRNEPNAMKKMECAPKNSLLFLHNHPKNSCFSEVDLQSFMTADAIYMMSVIGNNGRIFFLIKTDDYDKTNSLIYYEDLFEHFEGSSVKEFLRTCGKVGLKFVYGGE